MIVGKRLIYRSLPFRGPDKQCSSVSVTAPPVTFCRTRLPSPFARCRSRGDGGGWPHRPSPSSNDATACQAEAHLKLQTGVRMQNAGPFALALVFALAACGGDNGTPPPPTPVFTSLTVSATTLNLVDGDQEQLTATPRDQNGAAMTGLPDATFAVESGTAASVTGGGLVTALEQGSATVRASLTSGGITKTATTNVTVTALQTSADVTASASGQTFSPATVKIATGGQVTWSFPGIAHNVIWDASEPPNGDIPTHSGGETEARSFPNAGSYPYHCSIHGAGMSGTVIVRTP